MDPNMLHLDEGKRDKLQTISDRLAAPALNSESRPLTSTSKGNGIYPANLVVEGCDQHSRWFLRSLVTSVALKQRAPFLALKTHGLVLDESRQKMSKTRSDMVIDPEDLVLGTLKADGARSHGYGPDVLRLWVANHDTDKDIAVTQESLTEANQQVKMFRQVAKQLLGNLFEFDPNEQRLDFSELNKIDRMMKIMVIEFLTSQRKIMDQSLDVREYTQAVRTFMAEYVVNFYLELVKDRLMFGQGTQQFLSAQHTLLDILNALMLSSSPVLIYTSQEIFEHMDACLFPSKNKPTTVFQLPWPHEGSLISDHRFKDRAKSESEFRSLLSNFSQRSNFKELL